MAEQHQPLRVSPTIDRRPPGHIVHRSAAASLAAAPINIPYGAASRSLSSALSRPMQNAVSVSVASPVSIQTARVSHPSDPAEREATQTAKTVMQMGEPVKALAATAPVIRSEEDNKKKNIVQRAAQAATPPIVKPDEDAKKSQVQRASMSAAPPAAVSGAAIAPAGGGAPLPASTRSFMEPRFGADFGNVRVHADGRAAEQSASLNAHAFTVGEHVFFGRNQFQPESGSGRELIAHELTHTIQQGAAIQREAIPSVSEHREPQIQRLGIGDALDHIADKANFIPGFRLLTIVLGVNPINMSPVERNAANILRGMLELIPITGALIVQALDHYGILAKVGGWADAQIRSLGMVGGAIKQSLSKFLDSLDLSDVLSPDNVWERAKRIFTEPIDRLVALGISLVSDILGFIREAILMPLARLAEGTRGYDLLKAVLGQDPVTGEKVAPTAEAFVSGFLKLIGQEDIWENMQKAKALPRVWVWFQGALAGLKAFVAQIPPLFVATLKSLGIADLIAPLTAFGKVAGVFGNVVGQFVSWGLNAAWTLLEIIFDVVSPGALGYIKKTGAALKGILKNPLPFVGNLVKAAKFGFTNFAGNFLTHLKAGLIDWLTGSLPGIYIPKAFSLPEIAKFVFSVLGLTWANIRAKLVKVVGEPAVKVMETGFEIVVTLIRDGPAAAWNLIKEQLANLKDMVIGGITDFVVDMVVKKAIPKLISMFIPGAGFISAILSIYDTVMIFVNKISQIIAVVKSFIDSIVAIPAGQIAPAAQRVEGILANLLSLAINFLAGFAGLGKVADKIMGVINKIRAPIDKAIDWLIGWIVKGAKSLVAKGKAAVGKLFNWAFGNSPFKDDKGNTHTVLVNTSGTKPFLAVASEPMAASAFLDAYLKKKDKADPKKVKQVRDAIAAADQVVVTIAALKETDASHEKEKEKLLRTLLEKNVAVSQSLQTLMGEGALSLEVKELYLLEGLTGTYGSMPKPKGDNFTADHQPQAAVLQAAQEFAFFDTGGKLHKRAEGRAKLGFAINLHKSRHMAGATFGGKGKATKEDFNKKVAISLGGAKTPAQQRKIVISVLKEDLKRDVAAIKTVVNPSSPHWADLNGKIQDKTEREAFINSVSSRIIQAEDQIANQDLDSLAG